MVIDLVEELHPTNESPTPAAPPQKPLDPSVAIVVGEMDHGNNPIEKLNILKNTTDTAERNFGEEFIDECNRFSKEFNSMLTDPGVSKALDEFAIPPQYQKQYSKALRSQEEFAEFLGITPESIFPNEQPFVAQKQFTQTIKDHALDALMRDAIIEGDENLRQAITSYMDIRSNYIQGLPDDSILKKRTLATITSREDLAKRRQELQEESGDIGLFLKKALDTSMDLTKPENILALQEAYVRYKRAVKSLPTMAKVGVEVTVFVLIAKRLPQIGKILYETTTYSPLKESAQIDHKEQPEALKQAELVSST